jgi:hypothetical protein
MRVHLTNWPHILFWPWAILAMSFIVNLAIFGALGDQVPGDPTTGGIASIYIVLLIVAGAWVTQFFPFALGMSVTRRTFYAATTLLLVAGSVAFGIMLYLIDLIERATDGWGMSLHFFGLQFMGWHNPVLQVLMYVVPFLFLGFIGIFCGVVFKRWGMNGVFTLLIATILVIGAVSTLVTWRHDWTSIGRWFTDQSIVSLMAGWPMLLVVALAGGGYLAIRKATP